MSCVTEPERVVRARDPTAACRRRERRDALRLQADCERVRERICERHSDRRVRRRTRARLGGARRPTRPAARTSAAATAADAAAAAGLFRSQSSGLSGFANVTCGHTGGAASAHLKI